MAWNECTESYRRNLIRIVQNMNFCIYMNTFECMLKNVHDCQWSVRTWENITARILSDWILFSDGQRTWNSMHAMYTCKHIYVPLLSWEQNICKLRDIHITVVLTLCSRHANEKINLKSWSKRKILQRNSLLYQMFRAFITTLTEVIFIYRVKAPTSNR